jgi:hypothetical protein
VPAETLTVDIRFADGRIRSVTAPWRSGSPIRAVLAE